MKQHPIMMKGPLVNQSMAGIKTQTRRVKGLKELNKHPDEWKFVRLHLQVGTDDLYALFEHSSTGAYANIKFPYGQIGDVLYVRETWATYPPYYDERPSIICGEDQPFTIHKNSGFKTPVVHKAGKENSAWGMYGEPKWKPSIHMPKSACRLYLQITDIRVERLNEISEDDAKAEGVELNRDDSWHDYLEPNRLYQDSAKASFQSLWLKINGPDSWRANPFVWVISFQKIDKPSK